MLKNGIMQYRKTISTAYLKLSIIMKKQLTIVLFLALFASCQDDITHQNYIIYSNIGTKLKLQKKVCGIWWNVKAEEMVQGWEASVLKFDLPRPIPPTTFQHPTLENPTIYTHHTFPFSDENVLLFHIPIIKYDFTTGDFNSAFANGLSYILKGISSAAKKEYDKSKPTGLFCEQDFEAYIINGPYSQGKSNVRSLENKFYAKWFPCDIVLTFSMGAEISIKNVKFDTNDHVELYAGRVFGAIKHDGKWLAARITKYPPKE